MDDSGDTQHRRHATGNSNVPWPRDRTAAPRTDPHPDAENQAHAATRNRTSSRWRLLGRYRPLRHSPLRPAKPNVIVILADDLGWTDLACYGSDFYETPHLDRLRGGGMKFTQNYSACTVCSPTRAALHDRQVSGPAAHHRLDSGPHAGQSEAARAGLDASTCRSRKTTLAEVFQGRRLRDGDASASGTSAARSIYPEKHGFDVNIAGTDSGRRRAIFAPWNIPTLTEGPGRRLPHRPARRGGREVHRAERKTSRSSSTCRTSRCTRRFRAEPIWSRSTRQKLKPGLTHSNAAYAAMIESLDATVGRIRAKLDELKLADRTIIIFTSDNGGRVPTTSNVPLRVGKASAYEGGVRVPLIVHWPGVTKPGSVSRRAGHHDGSVSDDSWKWPACASSSAGTAPTA